MIEFDPSRTEYKELLGLFWKQYHGSSSKVQYKTAIWYHTEEQQKAIEESIGEFSTRSGRQPKIDVLPASKWYDAEGYHQKYYQKGGGNCCVQ